MLNTPINWAPTQWLHGIGKGKQFFLIHLPHSVQVLLPVLLSTVPRLTLSGHAAQSLLKTAILNQMPVANHSGLSPNMSINLSNEGAVAHIIVLLTLEVVRMCTWYFIQQCIVLYCNYIDKGHWMK